MVAAIDTSNGLENGAFPSEQTPLIGNSIRASDDSHPTTSDDVTAPVSAAFRRKTNLIIVCLAFVLMLGTNMQPAARVQIYEDVICEQFYASHDTNDNDRLLGGRCKARPIQEELAIVKGFEFFSTLLPTLLCSIPYGRLSDRIGRRKVLMLSLFGTLLSELWSLAVCAWPQILPIRLIWLSGLIQFIGGGSSVGSSIAHVIITDYADEQERTRIFLYLHASNVVSGCLGPVITAAMMEAGLTWPAVLLGEAIEATGLVACVCLPETLYIRSQRSKDISVQGEPDATGTAKRDNKGILEKIRAAAYSFWAVAEIFADNKQALLLLFLYAPDLLARTAFQTIGQIVFGNKFKVSYSRSSLVLSLSQAIEAFLVLVIIPAATFLLTSPRFSIGFTAIRSDRVLTIWSFAGMTLGHALLGLAPTLWLAIVGVAATAIGSGLPSLTLSLLGSTVRSDQVSVVYSSALMLSLCINYGLSPVLSALFNQGLALGWFWEGLPFLGVACIMLACWIGSFFVSSAERQDNESSETE